MSTEIHEPTVVEQLPPPTKPDVASMVANYWQNHATEATAKKQEFISALKELSIVKRACDAVDINRTTAYMWRNTDPDFRAAWDMALEDVTDNVEHSLYDQAVSRK